MQNYTKIVVKNPWQQAENVQYEYFLVNKNAEIPAELTNKTIIRTPVERIVCMSTSHIAALEALGETNKIVGVSGKDYIFNKKIQQQIENGETLDVGYEQNMNFEQLLSINADLIMIYGVNGETQSFIERLKELNIPVVINGDYLEASPLGKTEWLLFMAAFFNKIEIAKKTVLDIENEYIALKQMVASKITDRPSVFFNTPYKEVWYMPGGKSYMANLIIDAGADYLWGKDSSSESFSINFEVVINEAAKADFWLHQGSSNSVSDVLKIDERLENFQSLKNNCLYNNNLRTTPNGGNDFWETGVMQPHVVLKDLVSIFHQNIFPEYQPVYYKKLSD